MGNDNITGGGGDDTLTGGAGNDTLDGGTGQDGMSGGVGDDIYYVDNALDTVNELALSGTDLVRSAISFDLSAAPVAGVSNVQNVENLTLLGANSIDGTGNALNNILTGNDGANILLGNGGNDTLNGGLGTDTLAGGAGDDVMDGGAGADSMSGGLGNDTFVVDNAGDIVTEVAGEGIDTIKSGITFDMNANGANVENLTLVGPGNLDATGNALNNTLVGNDGDNRLDGGAGNDTMRGGKGNDTYVVDNASDVVTELLNEGIDKVEVRYSTVVTYNIGVNIEIVQLDDGTGPAASNLAFNAVGNALDNEIVGNSANNNLDGGLGNDVLMGGAGDDTMTGGAGSDAFDVDDNLSAGNDTMSGGAGDDFYVVNSAGDVIVEPVSSGTDRVESSINFNMGISAPNVEILYLDIQSGSINGTGNALDNTIYGNQQDNVIQGGAGDDTFYLMAYDIDFTPWASLDPNNPIEHNTGATLTGNDTIEGGTTGADSGTNDQLFADVADLTGPAGALHVHGVEHITLYSATTVAGSNTIDATDITGASDITVRDRSGDGYSPADMSITNLATGVTIKATDFHNDLNIARATDTGNDTQNITLNAFSGALNTSSIENVDLHIVQPSDGSDTDVDMSGATGVQHLSLTGASGDVNLHMPAGSDLKLQNGSMGVHVLDNALTSLTVHLDNVTAGLETDSALTSLDLDTSGSGGPSALNAGGSGAPLINVTGTQSLSLLVQNQDVDASGLSGGLFVGAGGSNAAVSLTGGSGDDDLNGGTGADRLNGGGAGIDHLSGDQGADTFVFNHAPNGTDFSFIHDFDDGTDKLELDSSVFTGLTAGGTLAADEFFKGDPGDASAVAGATGAHILFEANSGNLYYDNDAAAGGEKLFANIWHGNNIEHTDIQVV